MKYSVILHTAMAATWNYLLLAIRVILFQYRPTLIAKPTIMNTMYSYIG